MGSTVSSSTLFLIATLCRNAQTPWLLERYFCRPTGTKDEIETKKGRFTMKRPPLLARLKIGEWKDAVPTDKSRQAECNRTIRSGTVVHS
jgi:hypothetical protein